jgi:hypothetical protein
MIGVPKLRLLSKQRYIFLGQAGIYRIGVNGVPSSSVAAVSVRMG